MNQGFELNGYVPPIRMANKNPQNLEQLLSSNKRELSCWVRVILIFIILILYRAFFLLRSVLYTMASLMDLSLLAILFLLSFRCSGSCLLVWESLLPDQSMVFRLTHSSATVSVSSLNSMPSRSIAGSTFIKVLSIKFLIAIVQVMPVETSFSEPVSFSLLVLVLVNNICWNSLINLQVWST